MQQRRHFIMNRIGDLGFLLADILADGKDWHS